jgi:hypothetical protein
MTHRPSSRGGTFLPLCIATGLRVLMACSTPSAKQPEATDAGIDAGRTDDAGSDLRVAAQTGSSRSTPPQA